jgi:helicase MOV-10
MRPFLAMLMVPSHISYNDTLVPFADKSITDSLLNIDILPNPDIPIVFYGVEGLDDRVAEDDASWWNGVEASKIADVVDALVTKYRVSLADFGIMAPFREQVKVCNVVYI